jgi:hypothetical protein
MLDRRTTELTAIGGARGCSLMWLCRNVGLVMTMKERKKGPPAPLATLGVLADWGALKCVAKCCYNSATLATLKRLSAPTGLRFRKTRRRQKRSHRHACAIAVWFRHAHPKAGDWPISIGRPPSVLQGCVAPRIGVASCTMRRWSTETEHQARSYNTRAPGYSTLLAVRAKHRPV